MKETKKQIVDRILDKIDTSKKQPEYECYMIEVRGNEELCINYFKEAESTPARTLKEIEQRTVNKKSVQGLSKTIYSEKNKCHYTMFLHLHRIPTMTKKEFNAMLSVIHDTVKDEQRAFYFVRRKIK